MEIGVCRNGTGKLILDEEQRPYQPAMVSIIPNNYPHVTISNTKEGPSYWEYLFFDPAQIIAEMYPKNELFCRERCFSMNGRITISRFLSGRSWRRCGDGAAIIRTA